MTATSPGRPYLCSDLFLVKQLYYSTTGQGTARLGIASCLAQRIPLLSQGPLNAQKVSEPLMIIEPEISL